MKTVVWTGSRGWTDIGIILHCIEGLRKPFFSIVGGADGFDTLAEKALARFRLPRATDLADWERDGRWDAGFARNFLMLDRIHCNPEGGFVVAGWDGRSRGTKHCIDNALSRGIDVVRLSYFGR